MLPTTWITSMRLRDSTSNLRIETGFPLYRDIDNDKQHRRLNNHSTQHSISAGTHAQTIGNQLTERIA